MPDLSEFERLSRREQRPPCKAGAALEAAGEEREALAAAIARPDITAGALVAWCKRRDIELNLSAVAHHRAGNCRCGDD